LQHFEVAKILTNIVIYRLIVILRYHPKGGE